VHSTQLEQDLNALHALLEEGNITLQGMHGTVLTIRLSALSHTCMGIQPHGHSRATLTAESVSMQPPLSLTHERANHPG
jgi:ABC-type phosphate transport system auxiliary subunit